jgi:hypothetical protein
MSSYLILGAALGFAAFGQTQKPKQPAPLTTAERFALQALSEQRAAIEKQVDAILTEACATRGIAKERCRMQGDGSFIELPEPAKPEVKK